MAQRPPRPPGQDPLFPEDDPTRVVRGEQLRDEGMGRVEAATPPDWEEAAERALRYACEHRAEVSSEVVWSMLDAWGWPLPPEPRRLGPLMRKAAVSYGWLGTNTRIEKATRPSRHRGYVTWWPSRLFGRSNGTVPVSPFEPEEPENPF